MCEHAFTDISRYESGYVTEMCVQCGFVRYYKIAGYSPSGDNIVLQSVDESDVPEEYRE